MLPIASPQFSWMHNLPVLAKGRERCTLLVHPQDAERLGLADGAAARVTTKRGRTLVAPVVCCDEVMPPGVVSLPHGGGHDLDGISLLVAAQRPGVNLYALLDAEALDPASGNAVLNGIGVRLTPA